MAQITLNSTGVASNGALVLQSNGTTTAVTISTAQVATLEKDAVVNGLTVGRGAGAVSTNTAVGASALGGGSQTGTSNTVVGYQAAFSNTTGASVDAFGTGTLYANTTGSNNSGFGASALVSNTTGGSNSAFGRDALRSNTTASNNTAVGYQAGYSNATGTRCAFFGAEAGKNTTTSDNTFIGNNSGSAITTGDANTILGRFSGNEGGLDIRTLSNNIVISDGDGNPKLYYQSSNTRWILQDQFWPTGLRSGAGTNTAKYNTGTGELTYDTSSARYKDNIRDSVYGLSHVMQMRSTQFEYKDDGRSDVGLIAEELQPIIPELVGINKEGQADSVSYDRMVSVLVKAIQELKAEFDAYKEAHP